MKLITLANAWKRIGAAFVDFALLLGLTAAIYFPLVLPAVLDQKAYKANQAQISEDLLSSGLYQRFNENLVTIPYDVAGFSTLDDLSSRTFTYQNQSFTVSVLANLHDFYTLHLTEFGKSNNLSEEVFASSILQVGTTTSGIDTFTHENNVYQVTALKGSSISTVVSFIKSAYTTAASTAKNSPAVKALNDENNQRIVNALLFLLPVCFTLSFILDFLIPLFSKNGQTIGKYLFKLVVLQKDGYELRKIMYLPRWLVYIILEIFGGIASFGGLFLISYTMFMFVKKHRCLHDFAAGSIVASGPDSFWFKDPVEEEEYRSSHPEENERS